MFTKLREPFGKAGLIVGVIALVFAMLGGAYAATNSGGGKATASAKAKQGKPGKTGPAGPQGPAGPAGAAGAKGDAGSAGGAGTAGTNGKSVVLGNGASGCTTNAGAGGTSVEVEGSGTKKFVCNGKPGAIQPGETLPSEATETGAWSFGPLPEAAFGGPGFVKVPVASFAIPLTTELDANHVHYINKDGKEVFLNLAEFEVELKTPTQCSESAATPTATPGNFCLYAAAEENTTIGVGSPGGGNNAIINPATGTAGAFTTGAVAAFRKGEGASASGTWVVTAP